MAFCVTARKKFRARTLSNVARRALSTSDAVEINAYDRELLGLYSSGHEFFLTVTLADEQEFDLLVDTGSAQTYFPCEGCPQDVCGVHEHAYYDWRMSKNFRVLNCTTSASDGKYCRDEPEYFECYANKTSKLHGACVFGSLYADGSEAGGYLVQDVVGILGSELTPIKMTFGCGGLRDADGGSERHDGMAGFGRGAVTFHAQLAAAGAINAHVFGFCSEGMDTSAAMLSLGRYDFGEELHALEYTRMLGDTELAVQTKAWKIGNEKIAGSSNIYTVLDSGTTMTYIPTVMYKDFVGKLIALVRGAGLNAYRVDVFGDDTWCFYANNARVSASTLSRWFPNLSITYDPAVTLVLGPESYLFDHPTERSAMCLGIGEVNFPGVDAGQIILGQLTLRDTYIEYDLEQLRVGMTVARCEKLRKKFATDSSPPQNVWRIVALVLAVVAAAQLVALAIFACRAARSRRVGKWHALAPEDDREPALDGQIELSNVVR